MYQIPDISSLCSMLTLPSSKGEEVKKIAYGAFKGATVCSYILLSEPCAKTKLIDCVLIGVGTAILERVLIRIVKYVQPTLNIESNLRDNNSSLLRRNLSKIFQAKIVISSLILAGINLGLMRLCIYAIESVKFFNHAKSLSSVKRKDISAVLFCSAFILNAYQIPKKINFADSTVTHTAPLINYKKPLSKSSKPSFFSFRKLSFENINQITERLKNQFVSQQHVIEHTLDAVAYGIINCKHIPIIFYINRKGSGTTPIIRALARELFKDETKMLIIDASKYSQSRIEENNLQIKELLKRNNLLQGGIVVVKYESENKYFPLNVYKLIQNNPNIIFIVNQKISNDFYHSKAKVYYLKNNSPVIEFSERRCIYKRKKKLNSL